MALKESALYSSLWASCDELRGGMDASQYCVRVADRERWPLYQLEESPFIVTTELICCISAEHGGQYIL